MDIGISTWAYQDLTLELALESIASLSERAEILSEARHSLLDPYNLETVECFDLSYTVHGLVSDVNIASVHERIRTASIALHREDIKASARAGASVYIVHPGYVSWPSNLGRAKKALHKSLSELLPMEEEFGLRIAVENMSNHDWALCIHPGFDLLGLGLALDVGHANTAGALKDFLSSPDIVHLHLHDNTGTKDEHLPLGKGNIEFDAVMDMIHARDLSAVLELDSEKAVLESIRTLSKTYDQ
jgi:sugar phosphate isomerase/epimerase